ncbi:MAG: phosphoglucosamine mutase, partial [Candidatus Brocadiia bacterium]
LDSVNAEAIRHRAFKVALDCCNGAGVTITQELLGRLGCEVVTINCTPDGLFPHNPEPTFVNLRDICRLTRKEGADVGFAQDPDADRLAVIAADGTYIGEEMTLALATDNVLSTRKGTVVINLSTTKTIEDIAARYDCKTLRVPVGEVNVSEKMMEVQSPIGGEGNGGVIDPRVHYGRDSLIALALILEMMALRAKDLKTIVDGYPRYYMVKDKISASRSRGLRAVKRMREEYARMPADVTDGVRITLDDGWVHVRPSNTEPIVRIIAEAGEPKRAQDIVDEFKMAVSRLLDA